MTLHHSKPDRKLIKKKYLRDQPRIDKNNLEAD